MGWVERSYQIWQWDLEDHKVLEGVFDGTEPYEGGEFGTCNRYFLTNEEGRFSFIGGSAFDKQFERAGITEGDRIRIEYLGKRNIGGGRRVNVFRLLKWVEEEGDKDVPF